MNDRDDAVLFIDGSNWYHSLGENGVGRRIDLDYSEISKKLVQDRNWIGTRYYIGAVKQDWDRENYALQQKFLGLIKNDDSRISTHLGRLELRPQENRLASELQDFLRENLSDIPKPVFRELRDLAEEHTEVKVPREKEVDVELAVDMVTMAQEGELDAAYLLSADGDYVPAVKAVAEQECSVYAVSPNRCTALQREVDSFITLDRDWFDDCYRGRSARDYGLPSTP